MPISKIERPGMPAGAVLQVVNIFDNTQYVYASGSSNQTTFYDIAGLQLSITPISTTSKILLLGMVSCGQATNAYSPYFRFVRNGTAIAGGSTNGYVSGSTAMVGMRTFEQSQQVTIPMNYVDSPGTTSAITYKIQICNSGGSQYPSYVNRASLLDANWVQGNASSFIAMEIAA